MGTTLRKQNGPFFILNKHFVKLLKNENPGVMQINKSLNNLIKVQTWNAGIPSPGISIFLRGLGGRGSKGRACLEAI